MSAAVPAGDPWAGAMDLVAIGVLVLAADGGVRAANRRACELLGRDEGALAGLKLHDLVHPEDGPAERLAAASVARDERYVRPDGAAIRCRSTLAPQRGADGEVLGFVLTFDESPRAEERFRRLLDGGWDVTAVTDSEGAFTFVGGNVGGLYGRTPEELAAISVQQLAHPDDRAVQAEYRRALLATPGSRQRAEFRVRRKDGAYFWIEVASVNLLEDPAVRGILSNSRDVTVRKQAEEQLQRLNAELEQRVAERTAELSRANAALRAAGRTKDEFLAAMSHELRTPLNAVLGIAEALCEGVYGPLAERQVTQLERLGESGQRLLELITDILDLTILEAGQSELQLTEVGVDDVCRAAVGRVADEAERKRLRLLLHVEPGFTSVRADERRLGQILAHLLDNAVKFTAEDGSVGLDAAVDAEAEVARFTVWDTGMGIASEDLARAFEPFVQLDAGLDRRHPGTGLGLALLRRLVELHGGSVAVESAAGAGSRFTVALPLHRAPAAAPPSSPPLPRASARLRVLVAEDDEISLALVRDALTAQGHLVDVARDGREALSRAREARPDVILMDVQMPVMDGLAATRALRADPALRAVPVIAVTALAMAGDRRRCLDAGADEYLTKPIALRALLAALTAAVER